MFVPDVHLRMNPYMHAASVKALQQILQMCNNGKQSTAAHQRQRALAICRPTIAVNQTRS